MSELAIAFTVPGEPRAWQRAGIGRGGRVYTQEQTRTFERRVRSLAAEELRLARIREPLHGAVRLHVRQIFSATEDFAGVLKPTRPDSDNCLKAVADALNGAVYNDDGQIAVLVAEKWYARRNDDPRTEISVGPVSTAEVLEACPFCLARRERVA